jgi:hypothetical protein
MDQQDAFSYHGNIAHYQDAIHPNTVRPYLHIAKSPKIILLIPISSITESQISQYELKDFQATNDRFFVTAETSLRKLNRQKPFALMLSDRRSYDFSEIKKSIEAAHERHMPGQMSIGHLYDPESKSYQTTNQSQKDQVWILKKIEMALQKSHIQERQSPYQPIFKIGR